VDEVVECDYGGKEEEWECRRIMVGYVVFGEVWNKHLTITGECAYSKGSRIRRITNIDHQITGTNSYLSPSLHIYLLLEELLNALACRAECFDLDARHVFPVERAKISLYRLAGFAAPYCCYSGGRHLWRLGR